jgi:hypothetical protein
MFILLAIDDFLETHELDSATALQILNTDDENDLTDLLYDKIGDDTLLLRKVYRQVFSDLTTPLTTKLAKKSPKTGGVYAHRISTIRSWI